MAENRNARGAPFTEIGVSGLNRAGGFVAEEFLPQLAGPKAARVYREMAENDPTIGAILFALNNLMRGAPWSVQPANDSDEARAEADFVDSLMHDMSYSWTDVLGEIATMFVFGYAPLEIVYKVRRGPREADPRYRSRHTDGRIGLRKLALRMQTSIYRWEFDDDGSVLGVHQFAVTGHSAFIPIEKLLLFRTTVVGNNPEGRSLLRSAYRPWFFKKRFEEIEAIGVERDAAGLPVLRVPGEIMDPNAPDDKRRLYESLKQLVTQVRRDQKEGLILPSDRDESGNLYYEFTLLSAAGSRQFDVNAIIDRLDRRMAMCVLADFLFLGQGSVGSWALSSDKTAMFSRAVGTFLDIVADTLNRFLLPRVWVLNGLDPDLMPCIQHGDVETSDLGALGSYLSALAGAGMQLFPDRQLENHLRREAGLPEAPEEGDDELEIPDELAGFFGESDAAAAGGGARNADREGAADTGMAA